MSYQEERLTEIADAIREVKRTSSPIIATDFADEILSLPEEKTAPVIDEAQEVTPSSGKLLSKVTVPPTRAKTRLAELVDGSIEVVAGSEFEGITSIGSYAFRECTGLTSITIPNSVTSIRDYAFSDCTALTSITIPNSVTSIGSNAFQSCSALSEMTCLATTPPTLGSSVFTSSGITASTGTIRVPSASLSAYQAATNWSTYANIMVGI